MTPPHDLVFLLDIENALLDNDWIELDLRPHQSDQASQVRCGGERVTLANPIRNIINIGIGGSDLFDV